MKPHVHLLWLLLLLFAVASATSLWQESLRSMFEANVTSNDRLVDIAHSLNFTDSHDTDSPLANIGPLFSNGSFIGNWSNLENADERDWPDYRKYFRYRFGGPRQHIGTLRKQRLFDTIYRAIIRSCDQEEYKGRCCDKCGGKDGNVNTKVTPIVYNENGKNRYRSDAHITISIGYAVRDPALKELFDLMARMAAMIYMIECELNTYKVPFIGSRETTMCNVGRSLTIVAPMKDGFKVDMLHVKIQFNGVTAEGPWSCEGELQKEIHAAIEYSGFEKKATKLEDLVLKALKPRDMQCFEQDCDQVMQFKGGNC